MGKVISFMMVVAAAVASASDRLIVPAHQFDAGGWKLDVQFLDVIGAPYLLAHGLGNRVGDATASVDVPDDGEYRVWAYTRNWADGHGPQRAEPDRPPLDERLRGGEGV